MVESDSLVCVQAINNLIPFPSQFGLIVSNCKLLLKMLPCVSVIYVKRSANRAIDCVARASCYSTNRSNQEGFMSLELDAIILADFSV